MERLRGLGLPLVIIGFAFGVTPVLVGLVSQLWVALLGGAVIAAGFALVVYEDRHPAPPSTAPLRRTRRVGDPSRHPVAVYDVEVEGQDRYFLALCECDWMGDFRPTAELSFDDARAHSSNVNPEPQKRT